MLISYSCRLYVIIAWQHRKIKEVALVHIVTSPALGVWLCLFAKGRACVRHTQKYHICYFERNEAGSVTIHLIRFGVSPYIYFIYFTAASHRCSLSAGFFFFRASLGNAYLEIPWEFYLFIFLESLPPSSPSKPPLHTNSNNKEQRTWL